MTTDKKPATAAELRHALENIVRTAVERAAGEEIYYCEDIAEGLPDIARRHLDKWVAYRLTLSSIHAWTDGEFGVPYDVERDRAQLIASAKRQAPGGEA